MRLKTFLLESIRMKGECSVLGIFLPCSVQFNTFEVSLSSDSGCPRSVQHQSYFSKIVRRTKHPHLLASVALLPELSHSGRSEPVYSCIQDFFCWQRSYPLTIMKKSSPCSPCLTTASPSSNEIASRASATVSLSQASRFAGRIINQYSPYKVYRMCILFCSYRELKL